MWQIVQRCLKPEVACCFTHISLAKASRMSKFILKGGEVQTYNVPSERKTEICVTKCHNTEERIKLIRNQSS